jgi:hypothetical protein
MSKSGTITVHKRSSTAVVIAALLSVAVLGAGAGIAWNKQRTVAPTPSAATRIVVLNADQPPPIAPVTPTYSFDLLFEPQEAEVQVDGKPATSVAGKVQLSGAPGSTHQVHLSVQGAEIEQIIAVTASGLVPNKLILDAKKAAQAQPAGAARHGTSAAKSAPTNPPATGAPEPTAKPAPKKADIAKDLSEFQ